MRADFDSCLSLLLVSLLSFFLSFFLSFLDNVTTTKYRKAVDAVMSQMFYHGTGEYQSSIPEQFVLSCWKVETLLTDNRSFHTAVYQSPWNVSRSSDTHRYGSLDDPKLFAIAERRVQEKCQSGGEFYNLMHYGTILQPSDIAGGSCAEMRQGFTRNPRTGKMEVNKQDEEFWQVIATLDNPCLQI